MRVTILTPAYNRAYIINRLYESLKTQTYKNFEWLIIDDGSTDNTKELINKFIEENKISIRYVFQNNGGKHRALNKGLSMIKTEMTFIVDSDDYLTDNAIEVITKYYNKYKNNTSICGFSFLRCFPDMTINGPKFKKDEYLSDYIECRLNEKVTGDKAEVYYTKCLKEFPFLEVDNEKFLFEDYVWIQMAEKYKTLHVNIPIYVGDYLEDGLTKNISKTKYNSPIGMMERASVMCSKKCCNVVRIKAMIMYIGYGKIAKKKYKDLYKKCKYKFLFGISFLLGIVYYIKLIRENKGEYEGKNYN